MLHYCVTQDVRLARKQWFADHEQAQPLVATIGFEKTAWLVALSHGQDEAADAGRGGGGGSPARSGPGAGGRLRPAHVPGSATADIVGNLPAPSGRSGP